jgi:hypothetical protein
MTVSLSASMILYSSWDGANSPSSAALKDSPKGRPAPPNRGLWLGGDFLENFVFGHGVEIGEEQRKAPPIYNNCGNYIMLCAPSQIEAEILRSAAPISIENIVDVIEKMA